MQHGIRVHWNMQVMYGDLFSCPLQVRPPRQGTRKKLVLLTLLRPPGVFSSAFDGSRASGERHRGAEWFGSIAQANPSSGAVGLHGFE